MKIKFWKLYNLKKIDFILIFKILISDFFVIFWKKNLNLFLIFKFPKKKSDFFNFEKNNLNYFLFLKLIFSFFYFKINISENKKINYTISVSPRHHFCIVRWPQSLKRKNLQITGGLFQKNLQITGLESKLFFLQGVNQNSPKLHGIKTY